MSSLMKKPFVRFVYTYLDKILHVTVRDTTSIELRNQSYKLTWFQRFSDPKMERAYSDSFARTFLPTFRSYLVLTLLTYALSFLLMIFIDVRWFHVHMIVCSMCIFVNVITLIFSFAKEMRRWSFTIVTLLLLANILGIIIIYLSIRKNSPDPGQVWMIIISCHFSIVRTKSLHFLVLILIVGVYNLVTDLLFNLEYVNFILIRMFLVFITLISQQISIFIWDISYRRKCVYAWNRNSQIEKTALECAKTANLISIVVPYEMARKIIDGINSSELPESIENLTVLFVEFEVPETAVQEIVINLEENCDKHQVRRIKWVGQSALILSSMEYVESILERQQGCENAVRFAFDVKDSVEKRGYGCRVGISSGKTYCGFLGKRRAVYDVWGDVVNTAARLMKSGIMGDIILSQDSFSMIEDRFDEISGIFDVKSSESKLLKGIGQIKAYSIRMRMLPSTSFSINLLYLRKLRSQTQLWHESIETSSTYKLTPRSTAWAVIRKPRRSRRFFAKKSSSLKIEDVELFGILENFQYTNASSFMKKMHSELAEGVSRVSGTFFRPKAELEFQKNQVTNNKANRQIYVYNIITLMVASVLVNVVYASLIFLNFGNEDNFVEDILYSAAFVSFIFFYDLLTAIATVFLVLFTLTDMAPIFKSASSIVFFVYSYAIVLKLHLLSSFVHLHGDIMPFFHLFCLVFEFNIIFSNPVTTIFHGLLHSISTLFWMYFLFTWVEIVFFLAYAVISFNTIRSTSILPRVEYSLSQSLKVIANTMEKQLEGNQMLLHQVFPGFAAKEFIENSQLLMETKLSNSIIHRQTASLACIDLVGFTDMTRMKGAHTVMGILNCLYSAYDSVLDEYGLEKLCTVGDAYIFSVGFPEKIEGAGVKCVEVTIRLLERTREISDDFLKEYNISFDVRAGIIEDELRATLLGRDIVEYQLVGQSMTHVLSIQSYAQIGCIAVDQATYKAVKSQFRKSCIDLVDIVTEDSEQEQIFGICQIKKKDVEKDP